MFSWPAVPTVDVVSLPADTYLLDVREPEEWVAGHAPGACHIPLGELGLRAGEVPRDRTVHVICKVGGRSAQAARFLIAGDIDAVNVDGGMLAWVAAGRPMISETGDEPWIA